MAIGDERVGAAAGAVQGEDELVPGSFPEWLLRGQSLEFGHMFSVLAEGQSGIDEVFQRGVPLIVEPGQFGLQLIDWQAVQGWTTPQVQCRLQVRLGRCEVLLR